MKTFEEKSATLIDKIRDRSLSDSEIYHEVEGGLCSRSENHEAIVEALTNYRPILLKNMLPFIDEMGL